MNIITTGPINIGNASKSVQKPNLLTDKVVAFQWRVEKVDSLVFLMNISPQTLDIALVDECNGCTPQDPSNLCMYVYDTIPKQIQGQGHLQYEGWSHTG